MSLRTLARAACLALALALLLPIAPAARADTSAPPYWEDPWYVFSYGPNERYREILDRYGNAPAALSGVDARRLEEIIRQFTILGDGEYRTLGYSLHAPVPFTPEQQALLESAEEGRYVEGLYRTLESAFMLLDGTLLFDFSPDTSYGVIGDRYVTQTRNIVGADGLHADEYLIVDLETGERYTPLAGRYVNWCTALGDGWFASTSAFTEYGGDYYDSNFVLMDAGFNVVKTVPCRSSYPDTWKDEPVVIVNMPVEGKEQDTTVSVLDVKGELIAGPFPYGAYIAEYDGEPRQLIVYDKERTGVVDKATGEIAWRDNAQSAPRGGLVVAERSEPIGRGVYQTMATVTDEAGKVVVPERLGSVSFTETSPLLFSVYGETRAAAVFSRTGELLGEWDEGVAGSGLVYEQGMVYVVTAEELLLIEGRNVRSIPMPFQAKYAWLSAYGDLLALDYYDETASNSYTSLISADRTAIQDPLYSSIYPVDYENMSRGLRASKESGRRSLYGILDAQGREIIPCRFTQLYADDRGEYYYAAAGRYYGLVDARGDWVLRRSEMRHLSD